MKSIHSRLAAVCLAIILSSCSILAPKDPAIAVVERMYDALSKGDSNAYMDTILPSNLNQGFNLNLLGVLNALSPSIGGGGFSLGLNLSSLTQVTFSDLRFTLRGNAGSAALVQAEGHIRMPGILLNQWQFCQQHDVALENGRWYVNLLAPGTTQRAQTAALRYQQELAALPGDATLDQIMKLTESVAMNQCE